MKQVFADTHYFVALFNVHEAAHLKAAEYSLRSDIEVISTQLVMTELANGLARTPKRVWFAEFLADFSADPANRLVSLTDELFHRGVELYEERQDKHWSLVD